MPPTAPALGVGQPAPLFALPSIQGAMVDLAAYRGRLNVIVWLSRGFTCPFCLMYMDGIRAGYEQLVGIGTEVIQVAPNLLEAARNFFRGSAAPFPFVCDPDKRLYAMYAWATVARSTPAAPPSSASRARSHRETAAPGRVERGSTS